MDNLLGLRGELKLPLCAGLSCGLGLRIGRGRDAHAPRGCAMWGGADLGREGLCRKRENDEEGNLVGMRKKHGKTKIPQCRGACGTRGSNTLEECYACTFFFSLRFSIYR